MSVLLLPFDKNFEKSPGTFDFGGFIIIVVSEFLFAVSAALMKFSKKQSAAKLTRRYPLVR